MTGQRVPLLHVTPPPSPSSLASYPTSSCPYYATSDGAGKPTHISLPLSLNLHNTRGLASLPPFSIDKRRAKKEDIRVPSFDQIFKSKINLKLHEHSEPAEFFTKISRRGISQTRIIIEANVVVLDILLCIT